MLCRSDTSHRSAISLPLLPGLLTAIIAFSAPILLVAVAEACPQHARYKSGHGYTTGDCNGQRIGPLTWTVRTSHPLMHRASRNRNHLEVHLRGHRIHNVHRRPLNVALVLDRSGSMRGSKMRDAKEAARRMIRLLEPGDVISVVSYSNDVRVDWRARRYRHRDRRAILRVIDKLAAGGSTFLEGGMREGARQIERFMDGRRVTRVVLVSDGNANVGVRSGPALENIARRLSRLGISVTTVGLGLDYNEDTMTAIAQGGAGSYYYVRESRELAATLRAELRSMLATAARMIEIRIRPRPGVSIRNVHGYDAERDGNSVIVLLPDLAEGAERSVLVELSVRADYDGIRRLADVELRFTDPDGRRFTAWSQVDAETSDDRGRIERARDFTVLKRVEEHRIARALKDSATLVKQGRGAEAQRRIQSAIDKAAKVQGKAKDKRLGRYLKRARQQATAAPAAARAGRSSREAYNKSNKADAFSMSRY